MARMKDLSVGKKDLFLVDPAVIKEKNGWNVRIQCDGLTEHIRQLADSIKENGVQQPLTVYQENDELYVSDGHCRLQAVKLAISEGAEIKSVPVRPEDRYTNVPGRKLSVITRNSYRQLLPIEKANAVKDLLSFGWSVDLIAKKTGMSRQTVDNLIVLSSSPEEIKNAVTNGDVSATTVISMRRECGDESADIINKGIAAAKKKGRKRATKNDISSVKSSWFVFDMDGDEVVSEIKAKNELAALRLANSMNIQAKRNKFGNVAIAMEK